MSFEHTPRRIVSLQPSATVILQAIGELDRLVACTRYCRDVCPDVATSRVFVNDSWTAKTDEIERAWEIMDPLIAACQPRPQEYAVGTCGPAAADEFMARDGRSWHATCA